MELLRDLWPSSDGAFGDDGAKGIGGHKREDDNPGGVGALEGGEIGKDSKRSYAQAASSSSSGGIPRSQGKRIQDSMQVKIGKLQSGACISGAKRLRSPVDATCGRCFRSTHKTSECRHQVVCLRCA